MVRLVCSPATALTRRVKSTAMGLRPSRWAISLSVSRAATLQARSAQPDLAPLITICAKRGCMGSLAISRPWAVILP